MIDQGVKALVLVTRPLVPKVNLQEECGKHHDLQGEGEPQVQEIKIQKNILIETKLKVDLLLMIGRDDLLLLKEIKVIPSHLITALEDTLRIARNQNLKSENL